MREQDGITPAKVVPNWFGAAIPEPDKFNIDGDVYVILYFHPLPSQAGYRNIDYPTKSGDHGGTDWKRLYAYVDRLGGQAAGAIDNFHSPANRLVIFPFLTDPTIQEQPADYTALPVAMWFDIIHDILLDININIIPGICQRPKKIIVATFSNGAEYLNAFLDEVDSLPTEPVYEVIEAWDFDTAYTTPQRVVEPHGRYLRAYWHVQGPLRSPAIYINLPGPSWTNYSPTHAEVPPLPNPGEYHHMIRDTMFLDAISNIEKDKPNT